MTRRAGAILAAGLALAAIAGPAARANLVVNPTFVTGSFTPGWTTSGTSIQIQTTPYAPPGDTCYASFTGGTDTLSQPIATSAGQSYTLSFSVLSESAFFLDMFTVDFGGFTDTITGDQAGGTYHSEVFTVPGADIAGGSTTLSFQGSNPSSLNWDLDNVSIVAQSSAAPEPPAAPLLAGAVLSMLVLRRRGRSAAV
jgi:hypothetical protein